jgi:hypothetical protein
VSADVSSSCSSASPGLQVKWSYLLSLQQSSKKWRAATAGCRVGDRDAEIFCVFASAVLTGSGSIDAELERSLILFVQLMRTLAAVAPLPVCNNPSCESLAGVSAAAAACQVCAGCRCRYCSVACQRADWLRHKRACRRMAAAGAACL